MRNEGKRNGYSPYHKQYDCRTNMEEALPEKKKDNTENVHLNVLDTRINVEKIYRTNVHFTYTIPYFHDIISLTFEC